MSFASRHLFATSISEITARPTPNGTEVESRYLIGQSSAIRDGFEWRIRATSDLQTELTPMLALNAEDVEWLSTAARPSEELRLLAERVGVAVRAQRRRRVIRGATVHDRSESALVVVSTHRERFVASLANIDIAFGRIVALMQERAQLSIDDVPSVPWVFTNGSGAVLLHEAVGHPAELGISVGEWPAWLAVFDDPHYDAIGKIEVDDIGELPSAADLLDFETPQSWRRLHVRDVPLRRMSNLRVESSEMMALPEQRLEVVLMDEGTFDPHSDDIAFDVRVAYYVDDESRRRVEPFRIKLPRSFVAAQMSGAHGTLTTYPGVICSSEGQALPVGGASVDLIVEALR